MKKRHEKQINDHCLELRRQLEVVHSPVRVSGSRFSDKLCLQKCVTTWKFDVCETVETERSQSLWQKSEF